MIQEHWLFPSNLDKLNDISRDYVSYGSSALGDAWSSAVPWKTIWWHSHNH